LSKAFIVTGLGFGDEGKGTIVDALALHIRVISKSQRRIVVIRHGGGPQAGHNVVYGTSHHTFSQFGSGSFVSGCDTHLSHYMYINPVNMVNESEHLVITDILSRTYIAENAHIVTPYHQWANRAREAARSKKHGTCGEGHGETVQDYLDHPDMAIRFKDLGTAAAKHKLRFWHDLKREHIEELGQPVQPESVNDDVFETILSIWTWLAKKVTIVPDWYPTMLFAEGTPVIFEGSQGVLLDEWRGTHPHTTWATTTDHNARSLIGTSDVDVTSIGVLRSYATRHGQGPFPTEDRQVRIEELHNNGQGFQGRWRRGNLDLVLAKYAIDCCEQVDHLAMTHLDRFVSSMCVRYEGPYTLVNKRRTLLGLGDLLPGPFRDLDYQQRFTDYLRSVQPVYEQWNIDTISARLGLPISIRSNGPTSNHKLFLTSFLEEFDSLIG
jgi:adenylosuccinate synthase